MKKSAFMDRFGKFFRTYSIVAVLAFVFIFFSITTDAFLTPANILNIIRAVSMVGLICCGYSLVMISGGVDADVTKELKKDEFTRLDSYFEKSTQ